MSCSYVGCIFLLLIYFFLCKYGMIFVFIIIWCCLDFPLDLSFTLFSVIKRGGKEPLAIPCSMTHDWSIPVYVKAEMVHIQCILPNWGLYHTPVTLKKPLWPSTCSFSFCVLGVKRWDWINYNIYSYKLQFTPKLLCNEIPLNKDFQRM